MLVVIDPFNKQYDISMFFFQTATAIGCNKSRDLFQPITIVVDKNN